MLIRQLKSLRKIENKNDMKKEVKIGLAGIAALLILFFGINYLKGINSLNLKAIIMQSLPM